MRAEVTKRTALYNTILEGNSLQKQVIKTCNIKSQRRRNFRDSSLNSVHTEAPAASSSQWQQKQSQVSNSILLISPQPTAPHLSHQKESTRQAGTGLSVCQDSIWLTGTLRSRKGFQSEHDNGGLLIKQTQGALKTADQASEVTHRSWVCILSPERAIYRVRILVYLTIRTKKQIQCCIIHLQGDELGVFSHFPHSGSSGLSHCARLKHWDLHSRAPRTPSTQHPELAHLRYLQAPALWTFQDHTPSTELKQEHSPGAGSEAGCSKMF